MSPLFERIFDLLLEIGSTFWLPVIRDYETLIVVAEGKHACWHCRITPLEHEQYLLVEVALPVRVPVARVQDVEEYAVRASALIAIGGFTFDHEAGVVAFKHSLDVADTSLTLDRFCRCIDRAVMTADEHLQALMAVIYTGTRPVDALEMALHVPLDAVMKRANDKMHGFDA